MMLYLRQINKSLHQRSKKRKVLSVSRNNCHVSVLFDSNFSRIYHTSLGLLKDIIYLEVNWLTMSWNKSVIRTIRKLLSENRIPNLSVKFRDENRYGLHEEVSVVRSHHLAAVSGDVQRAALRVQREEVDKTETRRKTALQRKGAVSDYCVVSCWFYRVVSC